MNCKVFFFPLCWFALKKKKRRKERNGKWAVAAVVENAQIHEINRHGFFIMVIQEAMISYITYWPCAQPLASAAPW